MTEIIAGEYVTNELSKNANGGTEQMAKRMVRDIDPELLKKFHIVHGRVRDLKDDGLKKIFVCHDLPNDPELEWLSKPELVAKFDKIVFVSHWQAEMFALFYGLKQSQYVVIRNAIEPIFDTTEAIEEKLLSRSEDDIVRIIYHTTPHRGLALFPPIIEALNKTGKKVAFDIYSSFGVYGWEERDEHYKPLFDALSAFPNVTLHGAVSNETIRSKLKETDIFFYPSVWPETSCISAMEALAAGNFVVHSQSAALPETCGFGLLSQGYDPTEISQDHVNRAFTVLHQVISYVEAVKINGEYQSQVLAETVKYNQIFSWSDREYQWTKLLGSLV